MAPLEKYEEALLTLSIRYNTDSLFPGDFFILTPLFKLAIFAQRGA